MRPSESRTAPPPHGGGYTGSRISPSENLPSTHSEVRIGYREWARRNDRLGDIHSVDDRFDPDIDELMA